MILLKKHELLFVKGEKVAGTSAAMALSIVCRRHNIISPIDEIERLKMGRGAQNCPASRTRERRYASRFSGDDFE